MKTLRSQLAALLFSCLASLTWSQALPPVSPSSGTDIEAFPIYTLNVAPVKGATRQVVGLTGQTAYFYWAVANFQVGSIVSRLGGVPNGNATLSSSNYNLISPYNYPPGATVDILRTSTDVAPIGACNCAVTTGATSGSISDQSNSLSSYTVPSFNPLTYALTLTNEVTGSNASHLILRQGWPWPGTQIADLSAIGTGTIGGSGTAGFIPEFATGTTLENSPLRDNGTVDSTETFEANAAGGHLAANSISLNGYSTYNLGCLVGGGTNTFTTLPDCESIIDNININNAATGVTAAILGQNNAGSGALSSTPALAGVYGASISTQNGSPNFVTGVAGLGNSVRGTGTAANVTGVSGIALAGNGTGTTGTALMAGVDGQVQNTNTAGSGGTEPFGAAIYARSPSFQSGSIITNIYGLYVADQTAGGGTSNPNPHAVYTAGTAPSTFNGPVNALDGLTVTGGCTGCGGGSSAYTISSKTATYAPVAGDFSNGCSEIIEYSLSAISQTATLPSTAPATGTCVTLKNITAPYILAVLTGGSTTIDGTAFATVAFPLGPGQSEDFISDGTNYHSRKGLAVPQTITAGVGGVFLPDGFMGAGTGSGTLLAAEQPQLTQFVLRGTHKISNITAYINTGISAATCDWGIYDSSLNLLVDVGTAHALCTNTQTGSAVKAAAVAPIILPPGVYYFAVCASSASVSFGGLNQSAQSNALQVTAETSTQGNGPASSCTAGALPSTLASVTNVSAGNLNILPLGFGTP